MTEMSELYIPMNSMKSNVATPVHAEMINGYDLKALEASSRKGF
jgi:hypothetical protein